MKKLLLMAFTAILLSSFQIAYGQKKNSKSKKNRRVVVSCGVCNQKAILLPKPEYPKAARAVNASSVVGVRILIDEKGNVIRARAVSGHALLQAESVKAALEAKFEPFLLGGKPVGAHGLIVYNFDLSEIVEKGNDNNVKDIVGKAISLPKPPFPSFNGKAGNKPTVLIQAEIDEEGNVTFAKAITGHPVLRVACEAAARAAKFSQTKVAGVPVKAVALIGYEFVLTDTLSINVAVKSIKAKR